MFLAPEKAPTHLSHQTKKTESRMKVMKRIIGIGGCLALVACASAQKPSSEEIAQAQGAERSAREVGAEHVPQAALHLKLSQEELAKSNALTKEGKNEEAEQMLQRSKIDAELSLALTRQDQALAAAAQENDKLKAAKEKVQ
jgi:hypothetical protein